MENQKTYPIIAIKTRVGAMVRTSLIVVCVIFSLLPIYQIGSVALSLKHVISGTSSNADWIKLLIILGVPIFLWGLAWALESRYVKYRYICGACRHKVPRLAKICVKCHCNLGDLEDSTP